MGTKENQTFYDLICTHAKATPNETAMQVDSRKLSYDELVRRIDLLAKAMIAAGISKGDRVIAYGSPGIECSLTLMAAMRIGAVWAGLNPRYTFPEITYVLDQLKPKLLFCSHRIGKRQTTETLKQLRAHVGNDTRMIALDSGEEDIGLTSFDAFLACADAVDSSVLDNIEIDLERDPSTIIYTSGTTGAPKGALLPQVSWLRHVARQSELWGVERTRQLNAYPINHLSGIVSTLTPLATGGMVCFLSSFDPLAVPALIGEHKLNVWGGVPTMYSMVLSKVDLSQYDLSSLKVITWSGGSASTSLVRDLAKLNIPLTTMYAMTESGGIVCGVKAGFDTRALSETVGRPLGDCGLRLMGKNGQTVSAPGQEGEIQLNGNFLFLGYLRPDGSINRDRTDDGWFPTGDLGTFDDEGNLRLVGRSKDFFKSGGFNVYPKEIELTLDAHPDVRFSAVVPAKDDHFGEIGQAFLQLAEGASFDPENIETFCKERLANYKVPKKFSVLSELPTLANGKIDKVALRQQAQSATSD